MNRQSRHMVQVLAGDYHCPGEWQCTQALSPTFITRHGISVRLGIGTLPVMISENIASVLHLLPAVRLRLSCMAATKWTNDRHPTTESETKYSPGFRGTRHRAPRFLGALAAPWKFCVSATWTWEGQVVKMFPSYSAIITHLGNL